MFLSRSGNLLEGVNLDQGVRSMDARIKTEIGSDFSIPFSHLWRKSLGQHNGFIPDGSTHFMTCCGRASMRLIIRILGLTNGDEVLLPAYLYEGILSPFRERNIAIKFYKVNADLTMDVSDIESKISENTRILLIIHYFGFPQPVDKLRDLREANPSCSIVEDLVQSILSTRLDWTLGKLGDFSFDAYRKILPTLDGSLLLVNKPIECVDWRKWKNRQFEHFLLINSQYIAMNLKNLNLNTHLVPKTLHLRLFRYAERLLRNHPMLAEMSWMSKRLLDKFDFEEAIVKRRQNFQYLLNNWFSDSIVPLFQDLPDSVCPLGFPVLTKDRDHVRRELIDSKIYCPVHWELPCEIDSDEFATCWEISSRILMIPIDQRYGIGEMNYILNRMRTISQGHRIGEKSAGVF
jgi:dTDP-4-amino-4,6-dideoxygalactose transaminase